MPRRPPEVTASIGPCGGCCPHAAAQLVTGGGEVRTPRTWRGPQRSLSPATSVQMIDLSSEERAYPGPHCVSDAALSPEARRLSSPDWGFLHRVLQPRHHRHFVLIILCLGRLYCAL